MSGTADLLIRLRYRKLYLGLFFMFYDIKMLREDYFLALPSLYLHESVAFPFADGKAVAEKKQEAFRRKK